MSEDSISQQPFETGQVYEFDGSNLEIRFVGKTLVQYRYNRDGIKRPRTTLTSKNELKKYLSEKKAVLADSA
jgi:hypothetical protein